MALQQLRLSLQFGDIPQIRRHRTALARHFVQRCMRHALATDAEITVRIVGEDESRALNKDYRHKDKPTNVLTYEQPAPEIILALGVIRREAAAAGRKPGNHLAHLVVHGALHLQGHDHDHPGEARAMEMAEARILRGIGLPNPWKHT